MMDAAPGSFAAILDALGSGLPKLIIQFVTCAVLLAIGVAIYVRVTALILQLITLGVVALVMRNFRTMIEGGNIAAAVTLAGAQIAVALLNAAAMVPN